MRRFAAFATLVLSVALARAQTPPPDPAQATPEFRTGTAVVLLDVIARDKKGRPVRDLKAEELQVFENDQRCEIRSFRLVESEGTLEPAAGAVSAAVAPVEPAAPAGAPAPGERAPLNLVTLVFDRMNLEDNRLAAKAARDFVERGMDARTEVAVFAIGARLAVAQPFTADKEALLAAVDLATSGTDFKDRSLTKEALQKSRDARAAAGRHEAEAPPAVEDAATPTRQLVTAGDPMEVVIRQSIANAVRMSDSLQRQMEGQWSLYPLLALVKAQASLAGRKTLVFFSPGVQVPPNLDDVFRTIVSEANRANVSLYPVDTRGLLSQSDIQMSAAALREAATTSMTQQMKGAGEPTTLDEMQIMDTAESSLRLNVQQALSDLAEGTGGFLVANANDFGKAVDRLAADIRGYYEIQYSPAAGQLRRRLPADQPQGRPQGRRPPVPPRLLRPAPQRPDRPAVRDAALPGPLGPDASPRLRPPGGGAPLRPRARGHRDRRRRRGPARRGRLRRRQEEEDLQPAAHDARRSEGRRGPRRRALQRRVPHLRPPRPARGGEAVERRPAARRAPRLRQVHPRDRLPGQGHRQDEHRARELRGAGRGQRPAAQQPLPAASGGPAARRRPAVGRPLPLRGHAPRPPPRRAP